MKTKIIINARFLTQAVTGVQRFAVEICRELKKIDSDIIFLSPSNISNVELAEEFSAKIIGKKTGHYWEKVELPFYLNKYYNGALLVNLCNSAPIFYKKQIITLHDVAVYKNSQWFSKSFELLYKIMTPLIVKTALKVVTVSNYSKQEIIKYLGISPAKIEVVGNSVSHLKITDFQNQSNPYGNYILCVGSLEPRKNITNLIDAFLLSSIPKDYKLVIVGGKNKLFNTLKLDQRIDADDESRIVFTGYVTDEELSVLYGNAKVFFYPSLYEGFGIPPLEAMLHHCPVIVSNTSSLPEVCGDAALYVNPYDVSDMALQLTQLISDYEPIKTRLHNEADIQLSKYSWEKSAEKLYSIIQNQQ